MCTDAKHLLIDFIFIIIFSFFFFFFRLFLVNHSANWRPQTKTAHSLIKKQKKIGEIYHVCCLMASPLACIFENEACKGWNEVLLLLLLSLLLLLL